MKPHANTSRWIAASRAMETESEDPLFLDPFARELAGQEAFDQFAGMRTDMGAAPGPNPYLTIRTKFFDDHLQRIVREESIDQVVLIAAGMDTRAHRFDWPDRMRFFEVDQVEVFEQKEAVLDRLQARPRCDRRIVPVDLAGDWPGALAGAGFDAGSRTAFLVEGLFYYLDEDTARGLMERIRTMAADGSWIGLDLVNRDFLRSPFLKAYLDRMREFGCPLLFGLEGSTETFLNEYGWNGVVARPGDSEASYGRWPYPVVPASVPGVPSFYLAHGRRRAGLD